MVPAEFSPCCGAWSVLERSKANRSGLPVLLQNRLPKARASPPAEFSDWNDKSRERQAHETFACFGVISPKAYVREAYATPPIDVGEEIAGEEDFTVAGRRGTSPSWSRAAGQGAGLSSRPGAPSSSSSASASRILLPGDLESLMAHTREKMRLHIVDGEPANRYGSNARLPPFDPDKHVPTLALINTDSGAKVGKDILSIAQRTPYYQDRFFDIKEVVKDRYRGGLLDVFRDELKKATEEAKVNGMRARIISGGGDGTASFVLFILFEALKADNSRADEGLADSGNGFIWSDKEMAEFFPAIAQLPLGSANDFGNSLGWGRKYPGDRFLHFGGRSCLAAEASLQEWMMAVLSPASQLANFDVWGIVPAAGQKHVDFKVCSLGGPQGHTPKVEVAGRKRLVMKEAPKPVPMFVCLYFSAGFGGYTTARFQINRRKRALTNQLEYVRQAANILRERRPPELNKNLSGVRICCGGRQYFPPRSSAKDEGQKYREVGFLNINWQAGLVHGRDRAVGCGRFWCQGAPAVFNDSKMDMYRLKLTSPFRNPTLVLHTDKKAGPMELTFDGGIGKGIFFQWDGEARFAFSSSGGGFTMTIRKILNIPVVLGPWYDARITGDPFEHDQVNFSFAGDSAQARLDCKDRILRYVRGDLDTELNASRHDIEAAGLRYEE